MTNLSKLRSGAYSVACLLAAAVALASGRWLMGASLVSVTVLHELAMKNWQSPSRSHSSQIGWKHG